MSTRGVCLTVISGLQPQVFDDRKSFSARAITVTDKAEFVKETFGIHDDIGDARDYCIHGRAAVDIHLNVLPFMADEILLSAKGIAGNILECNVRKSIYRVHCSRYDMPVQ